ncbi:hypothetical protein G4Y79_01935 [Phototrophicus methaneseepsis]|uniref:DUF2680 domain-containing protein n=1 Tax=Phototrophicus methaneseepsis TaxID=2710758 RepID=A0A7S8IF53_9CHLR|nr:hypothetical protein [Phototrophicus methaneseepsis]QPC83159.1 hypothetical protein G4Y79_01935 [Phototrophicus methaneseepsis]
MSRNSSKTMIILVVTIALIAISAFVVSAQDDTPPTVPYGHGWMHNQDNANWGPGMMMGGHGMMGNSFGQGMMWGDGEPMMLAVAEALGLEPDTLFTALQEGQTLAEIAETQGVDLDTVYDAMFVEAEAHMTALVEAGTITQEQADEHLSWMRENIATMPMFSGNGFGPCMGEQAGFGMMGNRHGHGMSGN